MTAGDERPPAGWYADPHGARVWRYWDGAQWTDHVAPQTFEKLLADAVEDEHRWATWARWAFVVYVLVVTATGVVGAIYFDRLYEGSLFEASSTARVDEFRDTTLAITYQVCAFSSLAVFAVLATWTYRAARTARTLGIPIRRDPGLSAAAWFIPIVNLWWPPQTIRSFVPDRDQLRVVIEWWVCWIVTSVALAASLVVAGASSLGTAMPFVVVAALGGLAFAILGFHIVRIVLAVHQQMVSEVTPAAP